MQLDIGDVVVAYTDGISEAMMDSNEEYGEERLTEALQHCATYILNQVDSFSAGAKQNDDMTLVILRVP